jgi:hypothetical protein
MTYARLTHVIIAALVSASALAVRTGYAYTTDQNQSGAATQVLWERTIVLAQWDATRDECLAASRGRQAGSETWVETDLQNEPLPGERFAVRCIGRAGSTTATGATGDGAPPAVASATASGSSSTNVGATPSSAASPTSRASGSIAPAGPVEAACTGAHDRVGNACSLGTPSQSGVIVGGALPGAEDVHAYALEVRQRSSAHIFLGNLESDFDIYLYRNPPPGDALGAGLMVATSRGQDGPHRALAESVDSGTYTVFVNSNGPSPRSRSYALRVVLGPPVCAVQRDSISLFQLGLSIQPQQPSFFSLMTFNAFIDPPYADLYVFDWRVDGRPVGAGDGQILQVAAQDLPSTGDGIHWVSLTARGVRAYPDLEPRRRYSPPTLSVECSFRIP